MVPLTLLSTFPCSPVSFNFGLDSSSLPAHFGSHFSHAAEGFSSSQAAVRVPPHIQNIWLLIVIQIFEKDTEHGAPFSTCLFPS